jgi:phage terminase small subunit
MQGGLDDHANEQKRQQVLDMVGQTLAGFKANKASLEATKEQNMPLYQSCIQMLKSMISLCELLGLKPQMRAGQPGQEMPPEQAAPAAPPPAPPGGGASPAEGQPDPKAAG